jgi:hypothetical protein
MGVKTMKYQTILSFLAGLLLMVQLGVFSFSLEDGDKAIKIAQEMRDLAPSCTLLSSQEVKQKRLNFLNNNKDATITDLIQAIDMEIDGQTIVTLLKSFKCDVCDEYAKSVESDHSRGLRAMNRGFGDTSIETVMYWRLL